MKGFKMGLLAVILAFGAIAFTQASTTSNKKLTSYYWFNTSGVYQVLKTIPDEQSRTGCSGSAALCENGYNQNQLVNPGNPSQGVKPGQSPAAQIFQP